MGGPKKHTPDDIVSAHRGLGVTEEDFAEMIRLLVKSLSRHGLEPADIDTIETRYHQYQTAVVGAGDEPSQRSSKGFSGPS